MGWSTLKGWKLTVISERLLEEYRGSHRTQSHHQIHKGDRRKGGGGGRGQQV